jgi:hypothetical protein
MRNLEKGRYGTDPFSRVNSASGFLMKFIDKEKLAIHYLFSLKGENRQG